MKERPILFSAPMVRAILAGQKTQTRRVFKLPRGCSWYEALGGEASGQIQDDEGPGWWHVEEQRCPYGQPGDRLWVRETFFAWGRWETQYSAKKNRDEWHFIDLTLEAGHSYRYATNGDGLWPMPGRRSIAGVTPGWWKRPAIFIPRAASRIDLEVTGVRVERLQDISEADAIAEGIEERQVSENDSRWLNYMRPDGCKANSTCGEPRDSYRTLWEQINGPGSWDANPWVWVVKFKRLEAA